MKRFNWLCLVMVAAVATPALADNSRDLGWPGLYRAALGRPVHRATIAATAATPKDNTNTAGGASVTYTFAGGEYVCVQPDVAVWVEVIASASMTASGAKAVKVEANHYFCLGFLRAGETKVSVDPVAGSSAATKLYEHL